MRQPLGFYLLRFVLHAGQYFGQCCRGVEKVKVRPQLRQVRVTVSGDSRFALHCRQ